MGPFCGTMVCASFSSSKLINLLVPGAIPPQLIQEDLTDARKRYFVMLENQTLVIKTAQRLGCALVNIAPEDLVNSEVRSSRGVLQMLRQNCCSVSCGRLQRPACSTGSVKPLVGQSLLLAKVVPRY